MLVRAIALLVFTVPLMPVQAVAVLFGLGLMRRLPVFYHRTVQRIMGLKVTTVGAQAMNAPVLFVGNHVGYLDINVLGSLIEGCFVAKSEIAHWPIFGWLARLQRSVFIERRARRQVAEQRDEIARRLAAHDNLILFPEGSSHDGIHLLAFRTSLFAVAERKTGGRALTVQPFTIAYTALGDLPMVRDWRPLLAWYGDMNLAPHLLRLLGYGRMGATVVFHPPVTAADFADRKALAEHCRKMVESGLIAANSGRLPPPAPAPSA